MSSEEFVGAVQAATADMAAAEENRRDMLIILLGDVGRVYAQLRGFQPPARDCKQEYQNAARDS